MTLLELLPGDTYLIQESAGADADEVERAWSEAEHHLEVARRLGEDVPRRDAILEQPAAWRAADRRPFPGSRCATTPPTSSSGSSRRSRSIAT